MAGCPVEAMLEPMSALRSQANEDADRGDMGRRVPSLLLVFVTLVVALSILVGCGETATVSNPETTAATTSTTVAVTTTSAAVSTTSEPSTTETQPGDSADGPLLTQFPRLTPSDLAYVGVSSELGGEAWSLLLSPVGQAQQLAVLLAAYDRIVPEKGPARAPSSDIDPSRSLQVHLALKSGVEVLVSIEPPGPDFVVQRNPDLGNDERPPTASADATPLAEAIRQLLAPEGSTTPRTQAFSLPAEMPDDFGFLLGYGIYAKNVLDTFSGTFTKDLVVPPRPTATADLRLSQEEMADVYRALREMDIFGYPTDFDPESSNNSYVSTHPSYYLMIRVAGEEHVVRWEDAHESAAPEAMRLRDLIQRIQHTMIEEKPEFKALPPLMGGYA